MLVPQSVSYASSLAKLSPVTGLVRDYFNLDVGIPNGTYAHLLLVLGIDTWYYIRTARKLKTIECSSGGCPKLDSWASYLGYPSRLSRSSR
jgi:hypothetical protein